MPILHETFDDPAAADRAIDDLIAAGILPDDISVVMTAATKDQLVPPNPGPLEADIERGGLAGTLGGGLAALLGGLVLGGTVLAVTDGLAAPVLVAGPLAGALAGGVSGIAVGMLTGGLIGAGVAVSDAKAIEGHLARGAVVVTVHTTPENAADVDEILRHDNRGIEPTS
jgi:hypothetical protein